MKLSIIRKPIRMAWHGHHSLWASNDTEKSASRSCVVISPHPDDETIGMGATIARKKASGTPVAIIIVSDGRYSARSEKISEEELIEIRKQECREACAKLGVFEKDLYFLDHVDSHVDENTVVEQVTAVMKKLDFKPREVMSTSVYDEHFDHQACARAAKIIAREQGLLLRCCPLYWWAQGPWLPHNGRGNIVVRLWRNFIEPFKGLVHFGYTVTCDEFADTRSAAIACYKSQTTNLTGEESWSTLDPAWLKSFNRKKEFFVVE